MGMVPGQWAGAEQGVELGYNLEQRDSRRSNHKIVMEEPDWEKLVEGHLGGCVSEMSIRHSRAS